MVFASIFIILVLLIGGTACVFKHHLDSNFQYPHQKYNWIEERWYFKKNIPAFENVANLNLLPPKGAYVVALPMKIKDGSGGPLRIVARLP